MNKLALCMLTEVYITHIRTATF